MNVLVDTSVWSLALRRRRGAPSAETRELTELVREGRVEIIGPIRQELLSGVRAPQQFKILREHLRAFPDVPLTVEDFESAADYFNQCRAKGIQGSNTDFLICAVAVRRGLAIYTTDADFIGFQQLLPIRLYARRAH
jgi:hypothetical protein